MSGASDNQTKELVEACKVGDVKTVQRLLSLGVNINEMLYPPLYGAALNGHTAVVEMLLNAGADVNIGLGTPLYGAAQNGHTAVMEMLLKAGADLNKGCMSKIIFHQDTLMHSAVSNGHTAVVEMLLKAGADVNKIGSTTPLHLAAENGHYDVVAVLLAYNADGTRKDQNGRTALDLIVQKYKEDIALLFTKKSAESTKSMIEQWQNKLCGEKPKLLLLRKWASIAEQRAATAETRATVAEERAIRAEETASVAIKTAADAEERSTTTEQRAIAAEGKAITLEQRASVAEMECAILKQKCSEALKLTAAAEERARTAERRATVAEERASIANKNANTAEKRAVIAEARATVAETRASVAEERISVAEMEIITAEKKATDASTMVTAIEERTRKAEDAVKILEEGARTSGTRIAELVQTNTALEERATRGELQIRQLQEQLDKANAPSWVLEKDDIQFSDKELGRGGWGIVKAARFCGLDVAAKLLHVDILSPHNQQLFTREMNIAAMVRHPNILLFIGATMDQESVILTELMQTSLRAVLEGKEKNKLIMSRQQVSNIAMDVGKALNYLHLMKPDAIIHRDVSSANVLLEQMGVADVWKAKLSDFGSSNFARLVRTAGPGNFTYAAPESLDPDLQSPKMDVFSYGILLLEMSYGHFPDVQKRQELIQKLTWPAMKALVVECTTKDLKCRPSMSAVLIKLNKSI